MTLKQSIYYFLGAFAVGGLLALLSGCVMISKDIYVYNSEEIEIDYSTQSKTEADVQDLIDATLKLPLL